MKVQDAGDVPLRPVTMEGAWGCGVRWLLCEPDGAPNFAMRQFDVAPGGFTPRHSHPYEHEVYVLEGEGVVLQGDVERPLKAGHVVLVDPDEVHQFRNTGSTTLRFLCLIPNSAAAGQFPVAPECGVSASRRPPSGR
ncbi:MAG: cupin domain-containing protein [Planctomycetes bacterium]|nr:cupin domain-containing protein [Planctomycetota bacterium]